MGNIFHSTLLFIHFCYSSMDCVDEKSSTFYYYYKTFPFFKEMHPVKAISDTIIIIKRRTGNARLFEVATLKNGADGTGLLYRFSHREDTEIG